MPLTDKEREELGKKIQQQRKSMWKGQPSKDRRSRKSQHSGADESRQTDPEIGGELPEQLIEKAEEPIEPAKAEQPPKEPLTSQKEQLAEKIRQDRRNAWRGESASASQSRNREIRKSSGMVSFDQGFAVPDHQDMEADQEPEEQSIRSKSEKIKKYRPKSPALKLAFIVITSFIGAIALGVGVGYIIASRNLISF